MPSARRGTSRMSRFLCHALTLNRPRPSAAVCSFNRIRRAPWIAAFAAVLLLGTAAPTPAQAQWGLSIQAGWGCGPWYGGQFTAATVQIGGLAGCGWAGPALPLVPACAVPPPCPPVILPPIFLPTPLVFGPGPVFDMIYGPAAFRAPGVAGPLVPPALDLLNERPLDGLADKPLPPIRVANAEARARAQRYVEIGNRYFDQQNFRRAYIRYDKATTAAPDLVEAQLLKGQSLIAVGNYELAVRAFRMALRVEDWTDCPLRWDDVYGRNRVAKTAHIEGLAEAVHNDPNNPDLMLLLAMELFFDGQIERSVKFFQRYAALRDAARAAGAVAAQLPGIPAELAAQHPGVQGVVAAGDGLGNDADLRNGNGAAGNPPPDNRPRPQPPPPVKEARAF